MVKESDEGGLKIHAYGASASSVNSCIESITGIHPGKDAVHTKETGHVKTQAEVSLGVGSTAGVSGDEGAIIVLIVVAVLMTLFAFVWTIVMVVFSIVTVGGFVKRRFRTLVLMEKKNQEFIGKLAVLTYGKKGVLKYSLGQDQYDEWNGKAFNLFVHLKYLRQVSMFIGFIWGVVEIGFKLYQVVFDLSFTYDLWPFRYVMIAVFVPLILYSPILELRIRSAFNKGGESVDRLIAYETSFNPNHPMTFEEAPRLVRFSMGTVMRQLLEKPDDEPM